MRRLLAGLHSLLRRRQVEQDLDDELRAYLETAVDENLASGMSRDEAVRAARISVGSLEATKDAVRDAGWESRLESIWQDVRHALRGLRRSPGFAAVAILTLALGIGVNTAIFSVVNSLLLRALPVDAPEQLAVLSTREAVEHGYPAGWHYAIWDQIRQRQDNFDGALAWSAFPQQFDLAQNGQRQPADGLFVSWNFFQELGVPLLAGRGFTAAEDVIGSPNGRIVVISYGFWQRYFGGSADVVGQALSINRVPVTIVGITPPEFFGPEVGRSFDVALPIGAATVVLNEPGWGGPGGRSYLAVMLRLRHDQSIESASTMIRGMQRQIVEAAMPRNGDGGDIQDFLLKDSFTLTAASAGTSELRRQYSRSLVTVLTIATLVLLIACANVANLLLARSTAARRELSVRLALGAPRRRLVQQLLVESLVLSSLGALAGLLFARWASGALVGQLSTWFDRVVLDVSIDWRVLTFTAAVSIATALLFGTMPAIRASRIAPGHALKDSLSDLQSRGRVVRLRGGLVAAQVGLSVVLLVAAGLFIRSFGHLAAVPLGFESERVLVVDINTSRAAVDATNRARFFEHLADAVRSLPGVAHAAVSLNTPVNRGPTAISDFIVPGGSEPATPRRVIMNLVTPGWFETYGMSLRAGRIIDQRDTSGAQTVVVANEAFARKFLPGREAVGAVVLDAHPRPGLPATPLTIIGVVGNAIDQSLRADAFPTLYQPLSQFRVPFPIIDVSLSVRAGSGSPALLARGVASAITSVDRNLSFGFHPLADQVSAARQQERLVAWLSGFFGVLALLLAGIGLHGVTSYTVERQRIEIGIRMALGAQRQDVVTLAVRQTIVMTICGVAAGLAAAAVLTRYLQTLLFGITPLDPVTFVAAPAVLVGVAVVACYLPAYRASSIDPMIALRCE
jgi:putative ABC transport system permease protein